MRVKVGDLVNTMGFADHYFAEVDEHLRFGFVPYETPQGTDNGMTFIVAEDDGSGWWCTHIIGNVWPKGESQDMSPEQYAKVKQDDINAYLLERYSEHPTAPSDFYLWTEGVTAVIAGWVVDGVQLRDS